MLNGYAAEDLGSPSQAFNAKRTRQAPTLSWSPCRTPSPRFTDADMDPEITTWTSRKWLPQAHPHSPLGLLMRNTHSRNSDALDQSDSGKMPRGNTNPSLAGSPVPFPWPFLMLWSVACPGSHGEWVWAWRLQPGTSNIWSSLLPSSFWVSRGRFTHLPAPYPPLASPS